MALARSEVGLVGTAALLVFSRVFGLSLVLVNFRGHYETAFTTTPVLIGLAFGAYGLTMAIQQFANGVLSDRFGRKPVLLGATALFVAGSVWAAYAGDIWSLVAARLVQGMGAVASVAMAAVGETVPAERRTTAMALVGIPAGGGFLAGVAIGPILYPVMGMQGLFLLAGAIGLVAGILVLPLRLVAPALRPSTAVVGPIAAPVAILALAGFTTNWALTTTLFFLPSDDWRTLWPMLGVALVLVLLVSRPIDKAGLTWQPVAVGLLGLALAAPAFAAAGGGVRLALAGAAFFTVHAVLATTLPSQVSRIAGAMGGRGHGIQNVVAYLGTFAAGPVAGYFVGQRAGAFAVSSALAVLVALLVLVGLRTPRAAAEPA